MTLQEIINELEDAKQDNDSFQVGSADWAVEHGYNEGLDESIELLEKFRDHLRDEFLDKMTEEENPPNPQAVDTTNPPAMGGYIEGLSTAREVVKESIIGGDDE